MILWTRRSLAMLVAAIVLLLADLGASAAAQSEGVVGSVESSVDSLNMRFLPAEQTPSGSPMHAGRARDRAELPAAGPNLYTITLWDLTTWEEVDVVRRTLSSSHIIISGGTAARSSLCATRR